MPERFILALLGASALTFSACRDTESCCRVAPPEAEWLDPSEVRAPGEGGNLLVIVLDDVGVDKIGAYDRHPEPACTPAINDLAARGVRFTNAWVHPTCSPSRAGLLTGRHPSQTGIGKWIDGDRDTVDLATGEATVAELLQTSEEHSYTSAALGKWHLVAWGAETGRNPGLHPLEQGFSYHAGSLGNPRMAYTSSSDDRGYTWWEKSVDGEQHYTDTYMTTDTIDETLAQIETLPEPWFLWVSLNAPHVPLHAPPESLLYTPLPRRPDDVEYYNAALEAADAEIGRLLANIPSEVLAETTVMVLGDNGTIKAGIEAPWSSREDKGTVTEGGVRVPFIVSGPYVGCRGCASDALIQGTDLMATAGAMAGVSPWQEVDSISMLSALAEPAATSARPLLFSEKLEPNGPGPYTLHSRAVRDGRWKYVHTEDDEGAYEGLFSMDDSGDEGENLLSAELSAEANEALDRLRWSLEDWSAGMTYGTR